jgi:hypothetical protein
VTLNLEFPDGVFGARLEKQAQEDGLSVKSYCVHIRLQHLLRDASAEQKERWLPQVPATLRKNGCDDTAQL